MASSKRYTYADFCVLHMSSGLSLQDLRDRLNGHTFTQLTRLSEKKALFPLIRFGRGLPDEDVLALSTGGTESHKALKTRARQVWEYMWERSQGHDCTFCGTMHSRYNSFRTE